MKCGCTNRSVPLEVYERDFGRLLSLLTLADDKLSLLTELKHVMHFEKCYTG